MPKKFSEPVRESAKSRKAEKEKGEREAAAKKKEDDSWRDDDPQNAKKTARAEEKLRKQVESASKKAELKFVKFVIFPNGFLELWLRQKKLLWTLKNPLENQRRCRFISKSSSE